MVHGVLLFRKAVLCAEVRPGNCIFLLPMISSHHRYDALILGAGAAGLMCAMEAGQRGRRV
ncbi:MAG: NAD(P)/FAD-dependent oxidoreductase, partial [Terriglobales bacterium]